VADGAAAIVLADVAGIADSGGTAATLVAVAGAVVGTECADGGVAAAVSD
jgi:hypothetical protein